MTHEFDHVRDAFAGSLAGRFLQACDDALSRAWRSSSGRRRTQTAAAAFRTASALRAIAIAIAVAALLQPLLIVLMPRTVAPALPWWSFVVIAFLAIAAASNAEAMIAAWPASRLRRLLD